MTEEKFDALLENKEYEAAFDLVDKENFENSKKPQTRIMNPALIRLFIRGLKILKFQKDGSEYIDWNEIMAAFHQEDDEERQAAMEGFKMADRNGDGKISKEQFIRMMSKSFD